MLMGVFWMVEVYFSAVTVISSRPVSPSVAGVVVAVAAPASARLMAVPKSVHGNKARRELDTVMWKSPNIVL